MSRTRTRKLCAQQLESRQLLAVVAVDEFGDRDAGGLRAAISEANRAGGYTEIQLGAGDYALSKQGVDDSNALGDLDVTGHGVRILIRGAGTNRTSIDASKIAERVFHISEGASLELVDLSIVGGSDVTMGGGILNEGTLALKRVAITKNSAAVGGGVANLGTIEAIESSVVGNRARLAGDDLFDRKLRTSRTIHDLAFVVPPAERITWLETHVTATSLKTSESVSFARIHGGTLELSGDTHTETAYALDSYSRISGDGLPELSLSGDSSTPDTHQAGSLTAGSIDDSAHFSSFLEYYENRKAANGWDLTTAIPISVENDNGTKISGARIEIQSTEDQEVFAVLSTGTDGTAVFIPGIDGGLSQSKYSVTVSIDDHSTTIEFDRTNSNWDVVLGDAAGSETKMLDLAFVIDTTGSMSDELQFLLTEVRSIILRTKEMHPGIGIRLGLVAYRDQGDAYVSRSFDFTTSIDDFLGQLADQSAYGGGDYPEAMHVALEETASLTWSENSAARMLFLIADAPPHNQFQQRTLDAAKQLRDVGIRIFPVAASGVAEKAEFVMRTAAAISQGEYLFLTDDSGFGLPHAEPETESYGVERLDQLMQRMISSQITGTEIPAELILRHKGGPLYQDQIVLVEDVFEVRNDIAEHSLDVLQNDYLANSDLAIDEIVIHPASGTLSISPDGRSLIYEPDSSAQQTLNATYSLVKDGTTYHGAITIKVVDPPPLAIAEISLTTQDGTLITEPNIGTDYVLSVSVRDNDGDPQQIAKAYMDLLIEQGSAQFFGDITFGETFTESTSGTVTTTKLEDVGGAVGSSSNSETTTVLFTMGVRFSMAGKTIFSGRPADDTTERAFRVEGDSDTLPNDRVDFGRLEVTAKSQWQNAVEPLDVDRDGFVDQSDAIDIVMAMSAIGSGTIEFDRSSDNAFLDTSGDGSLTPRDLLRVINRLIKSDE